MRARNGVKRAPVLLLAVGLFGCTEHFDTAVLKPLGVPVNGTKPATANIGTTDRLPSAQIEYGQAQTLQAPRTGGGPAAPGDISLDFVDTDVREVAAQILGTQLRLNYTIDPGVHGAVTLHTPVPVGQAQLLPILQTLLAQVGATLVQTGGLYRVAATGAPTAAGTPGPVGATPGTAAAMGGTDLSGAVIVPLRFAGAEDLARTLQPFIGNGARITPEPGRNALLVSGDPAVRATLLGLVQAFDTDLLAGQSYALLPSTGGDAKDFASALQDALRAQGGAALAGQVRVVPMTRINSVLIVSSQPRYITDARRVYALFERNRRDTVRTWHVYSLLNSHTNDVVALLQQAFTPGAVTVQASGSGQLAPGAGSQTTAIPGRGSTLGGGGIGSGVSAGGLNTAVPGSGTSATSGGIGASTPAPGLNQTGAAAPASQPGASANPLLGGLDPTGGMAAPDTNTLRIIPNPQNNTVLIYSTQREQETVEAMLRKMDVLPLQVLIDATIAEVTLNDQLQYGTQFFFRAGGINGALSTASVSPLTTSIANAAIGTSLPGFLIGGSGTGGAPAAISALQAVTKVQVLSSPQVLVLDSQPARLQVGSLVPYLTSSSQSTLVANSTIVNQVNYQPTGVIMQVTPRVNSGGLVTLDIYQEVSEVDTAAPSTAGINSPTFLERNVASRIVVQDGQTIGLAGLISDSSSRGNSGIPWLKDVPILGLLAGTQNNVHVRTELLVLITPHVVHDQRDARALTEDLRDQLLDAAGVSAALDIPRTTGRADPGRPLRRSLRLEQ